jgi:hypothetical protein
MAAAARQTPEPASSSSHMLAGAGAGFLATALLHPLDLIKTRMHVQEIGGRRLPHYANLWHAFRSIVRLEGLAGLYQGIGPNVVGSTGSWAMYMFLYNGFKARLSARAERAPPGQRWSASWIYVAAATASGAVVSLIMHPVFTIKTRMQLQLAAPRASPAAAAQAPELAHLVPIAQRDNYASGLVAARRIIREEGVLSLYRGIGPSLFLVSHGAVQFLGYEHIKSFFGARPRTAHANPKLRRPGGACVGKAELQLCCVGGINGPWSPFHHLFDNILAWPCRSVCAIAASACGPHSAQRGLQHLRLSCRFVSNLLRVPASHLPLHAPLNPPRMTAKTALPSSMHRTLN